MIQWKDKTYSGHVVRNDDEILSVFVFTTDSFQDVAASINTVREVTEFTSEADRKTYTVTGPKSSKVVSANTYYLEFSTKPSYNQRLEAKLQEQSDTIDALLVALLEG